MRIKFWQVRSKWDYFAFIAVFQWLAVGCLLLLLALSDQVFASLFALVVMFFNFLAILTPLATVYGSRRHDHLDPGWLYHFAAFFFGPIVGVHYLVRTGSHSSDDEKASPQPA